jgi:RNase P/RNase MRP subunit p30
MTRFHDFLIDSETSGLLGWNRKSVDLEVKVLEASNWGELKQKIGRERNSNHLIVYRPENNELAVKAAEDPRIDIIIHTLSQPVNHVMAERASKNSVQVAFSLKQLHRSEVKYKVLKAWRDSIKILEKSGAGYLITNEAIETGDIRPPGDLKALISELGGDGEKAVSENPSKIFEKALKRESTSFVRPGVEKE